MSKEQFTAEELRGVCEQIREHLEAGAGGWRVYIDCGPTASWEHGDGRQVEGVYPQDFGMPRYVDPDSRWYPLTELLAIAASWGRIPPPARKPPPPPAPPPRQGDVGRSDVGQSLARLVYRLLAGDLQVRIWQDEDGSTVYKVEVPK